MIIKNIILILSISIVSLSHSQNIDTLVSSNEISLTVIPHICIAPRGKSSCISTVDIRWESINTGSFCLESDFSNSILQCWANSKSGFYQDKVIFRVSSKNITH